MDEIDLDGNQIVQTPQLLLPVWGSKFAPIGARGLELSLPDLLTREFRSDAHFAAYHSPNAEKLSVESLKNETKTSIETLVIDVDAATDQSIESWRESAKLAAQTLIGQPFGYYTRRGLRLIWTIDKFELASLADAAEWSRFYVQACAGVYHQTRFLVPDPSCRDWTRVFRTPHATRDGEPQRLGWVCGHSCEIGRYQAPKHERMVELASKSLSEQYPVWQSAHRVGFGRRPDPNQLPLTTTIGPTDQAIKFATDRVAAAKNGERNAVLFTQAKFLKKLVDKRELTEKQAVSALVGAAVVAGLPQSEAAKTVLSAMK